MAFRHSTQGQLQGQGQTDLPRSVSVKATEGPGIYPEVFPWIEKNHHPEMLLKFTTDDDAF